MLLSSCSKQGNTQEYPRTFVSTFSEFAHSYSGNINIDDTLYFSAEPIPNSIAYQEFHGFSYNLFKQAYQLAQFSQLAKYKNASWGKHDTTVDAILDEQNIDVINNGFKPRGNCTVFSSTLLNSGSVTGTARGGILNINPNKKYLLSYPLVSSFSSEIYVATGEALPYEPLYIPEFDRRNNKGILLNTTQDTTNGRLSFIGPKSLFTFGEGKFGYSITLNHNECEIEELKSIIVTLFPPRGLTTQSRIPQAHINNFSLTLLFPENIKVQPQIYFRLHGIRIQKQPKPDILNEGVTYSWRNLNEGFADDIEVILPENIFLNH